MNSHRGAARQSAHQAALSRRSRACSASRRRSTTSRRWPRCRTSSTTARRGTRSSSPVEPEEHGHQAVLGVRQRHASGQLRSRARLSVQGFPVRPLRRTARPAGSSRPSSPAARRCRSRRWKRPRATLMDYEGFVAQGDDARLRRRDRLRRLAVHGEADRAARALLRPRELRAVHAVPRGHGVDHAGSSSASRRAAARCEDFDTLLELADNMTGKTICVLSDSCAAPVVLAASRSSGTSSRR